MWSLRDSFIEFTNSYEYVFEEKLKSLWLIFLRYSMNELSNKASLIRNLNPQWLITEYWFLKKTFGIFKERKNFTPWKWNSTMVLRKRFKRSKLLFLLKRFDRLMKDNKLLFRTNFKKQIYLKRQTIQNPYCYKIVFNS